MATVTYGPSVAVTAKPQEPARRVAPPPLLPDQRKAMEIARDEKQALISARIEQWHAYTSAYAEQMSKDFGKTPDHYLHLLFSQGSRPTSTRKCNPYNAWSSKVVKDANQDAGPGQSRRMVDVTREKKQEYHNMTPEEKAELAPALEDVRQSKKFGARLTVRAILNDVNATNKRMEVEMYGLCLRTGMQGFFCVFKSKAGIPCNPQWYFTNPHINIYLALAVRKGWDVENIGALAEAFAVAGCDFMKFLRSAKDRADFLKAEIRDLIQKQIADLTGNPKVRMNYVNFERDFVVKFGIDVTGWTFDKFINPSEMSTSLPPLQKLISALKDGSCRFHRLAEPERSRREEAYNRKVLAGEVEPRKERQDKGVPRGKRAANAADTEPDEGSGNTNAPPAKRPRVSGLSIQKAAPKSNEFVNDSDVDDDTPAS
ncbi:uncharacterized protein C8Q71DRAFT_861410 [Rhodofomes roseus]|uniref:Uncharacterized protein n=1 Tax=Rhodofomes roseus TaxID=34475 RepID=A0A4Y9YJB2_9APHY|nr:uncharacterized protein C8Q71DRAFT_861410 [Rhodofomes roseus]KAH9831717.1 hypothetical protein C8Q71DRAFT_861410 [Rhodofomes roseus]TFY62232.1 hypothetical protein EVJ58_g3991 [Rhodofomes roseus]